MECAADQLRNLGNSQVVHVAEGEHRSAVFSEISEHVVGCEDVELYVPVVIWRRMRLGLDGSEAPLFAFDPAPVVDQFVAGNPDEPRNGDRLDDTWRGLARSAVDVDQGAGGVARRIGGQVQSGANDLVRLTATTERVAGGCR